MRRLVLGLMILSSVAFAHGIRLNLEKKDNMVNIYSGYDKKEPCVECRLVVLKGKKILLETKLSKEGNYSYEIKDSGKLTFKVNDNYGHLVKRELDIK